MARLVRINQVQATKAPAEMKGIKGFYFSLKDRR